MFASVAADCRSKTLNQTLCADGNIPVELVISINNSSGILLASAGY